MAAAQRWLALLGQCDHFSDQRRERRADRIRKSDSRFYGENKRQRDTTKRDRRENGGAAKVARFGKVAPSTFPPALANARRRTPPYWQRSPRQRWPISCRAEDESGFA